MSINSGASSDSLRKNNDACDFSHRVSEAFVMHLPIGEKQRIMIENQIIEMRAFREGGGASSIRVDGLLSTSSYVVPQSSPGSESVSHTRNSRLASSTLPTAKAQYSSMSPVHTIQISREDAPASKGKSEDRTFLVQAELHQHKWPKAVSILCGWDTCSFDTSPVGIPIRVCDDGSYETKGCYCSLSCAAAANLADNRISATIRGERHSILAMINSDVFNKRIRVAPERECLRIYGGSLQINEFRDTSACAQMIIYPPMRPFAIYQTNAENLQKDVSFQECSQNVEPWVLDIDKFDTQGSNSSKVRMEQGLGKFMTVSFSNSKGK